MYFISKTARILHGVGFWDTTFADHFLLSLVPSGRADVSGLVEYAGVECLVTSQGILLSRQYVADASL